jgi:SET domain-containing protein
MTSEKYSFLHADIEMRAFPQKGRFGLFATRRIPAGTLLTMWGGKVLTSEEYAQLPTFLKTHGLQIEDDLFQIPFAEGEPADYFNHCCDPNAGFNSPVSLVAMRDIQAGEEICFDYAMSEDNHFDEFPCACGAPTCRGQVSGKDWLRPELQERYFGFFSPYLQRRLNKQREQA